MAVRGPTAPAIARARQRYDDGAPLPELAHTFGVTEATFRKWRKTWGWPARRRVSAEPTSVPTADHDDRGQSDAAAMHDVVALETDPPDTPRLIRAVRRAIEAELLALQAQANNASGGEARSRALTNLTRTLTLVRDLETHVQQKGACTDHDDADAIPVDIAQLRLDLARRIFELRRTGDTS